MDKEVRLSFWQILMSPFISLKNMVTTENEVDSEIKLREDSTNKIESDLAKSSKSIDSRVDAYGNSGKAQSRGGLQSVKVDQKDLKPLKEESTKAKNEKAKDSQDKGREMID